jgi:hypothetical protein
MIPPVVLVSFNRPECTRISLAAIRRVEPRDLFLVCDGPRQGRSDDEERCTAVRDVLADIDWPCQVRRIFNTVNRGPSGNIETGLDAVFAEVEAAIVLEDDCVADPSFFAYCGELLDRYRSEPIGYIAGFSLETSRELFGGASYAFSSVASCLGWATWRDRWETHRKRVPRDWSAPSDPTSLLTPTPSPRQRAITATSGLDALLDYAESEAAVRFVPWDALWGGSSVATGKLAVTPAVNMIDNVGFAPDATNTTQPVSMPPSTAIEFPLVHPQVIGLNRRVSRELEFDVMWTSYGGFTGWLRRRCPRGRPRDVALSTLTSAAVIVGRQRAFAMLIRLAQHLPHKGRPAPATTESDSEP